MGKSKILFVSSGMIKPKKAINPLSKMHLYLNYGFLGLASVLEKRGHSVVLYHGNFDSPQFTYEKITKNLNINHQIPIFISIPSYFAIDWAKSFCSILKKNHPTCKIVAGGRWVIGTDEDWVKHKIPELDLIIGGLAESIIEDILNIDNWKNISQNLKLHFSTKQNFIPALNYSIVHDFSKYQPSVEISRGCGMGCDFCVEKYVKLFGFKSPVDIVKEIIKLTYFYKDENISPYFESSLFRPTTNWIETFSHLIEKARINIKWRCETRVDSLSLTHIPILAASGLKVIDLGLESASERQLSRMNKTKNPKKYLEKAGKLLQQCCDCGIYTKVNILLYPGETISTLNETYEWLDKYRNCITGLSVGPLILYRYGVFTIEYLKTIKSFGASLTDRNSIKEKGYAELNLSHEIDFQNSLLQSRKLSKEFMSYSDYFTLKSFSYFPRSFTYNDFINIVIKNKEDVFPFRTLGITKQLPSDKKIEYSYQMQI
jgi:radical SAM superfamily enzyme YgiQ (UPF0313 family)